MSSKAPGSGKFGNDYSPGSATLKWILFILVVGVIIGISMYIGAEAGTSVDLNIEY